MKTIRWLIAVGFGLLAAALFGLSRRGSHPHLPNTVTYSDSPSQPQAAESFRFPFLALAAVLLMIWSADNFRPFRLALIPRGALLLLVGGVVLLVALYRYKAASRFPQTQAAARWLNHKPPIRSYISIGVGVAALGFLILVNINHSPIPPGSVSVHLQMALFTVGVVSLVWGVSGIRPPDICSSLRRIRFNTPALWAVMLLTMLSLLFGLWNLEDAVHTYIDEFHTLAAVNQLTTRTDISILTPYSGLAFFPWLYPYAQLVPVALFGHTLAALRVVSVILAALTIPGIYLLAKHLFDQPTALFAALLLATFPPHIHFSRLSLINSVDPFVGVWTLAFLVRGLKSSSRVDFVLAGAGLGLTQYFYEGGKLVFPALVVVWLVMVALFNRGLLSGHGIVLMSLVAIATAAPLYLTWASYSLPFMPRMADVGDAQLNWSAILTLNDGGAALRTYLERNLLPPILHIIQRTDTSRLYYAGDTPLILGYMLPAFFLGTFHALWRWRVSGALLLLWVALVIAGNSLIVPNENTWSARYIVVFPVLALLMAVGVRFTIALLQGRSQLLHAAAWGLMIALAFVQPVYYFGYHLPRYNQQIRGEFLDYIDLFYRARLLPEGTTHIAVTDDGVYQGHYELLRGYWDFDGTVTVVRPADFTPSYLDSLPPGVYAFFIDPVDGAAVDVLRDHFPQLGAPSFSPYNVPPANQYALYYVSR